MPQLAEMTSAFGLSSPTERIRTSVQYREYPYDAQVINDWSLANHQENIADELICNNCPKSILLFERIDIYMQRALPWIISFTVVYMIAQVLRAWLF